MPQNITLSINGQSRILAWSEFERRLNNQRSSHDSAGFLGQCTSLFLIIQAGFILLETGSISTKRGVPFLVKKILCNFVLCSALYFLLGYGLSYGGGTMFIGGSGYALTGSPLCDADSCSSLELSLLVFRLAQAALSGTILSGALAERMSITIYLFYSTLISCVLHPIISRWTWHESGWASVQLEPGNRLLRTGVIDFAGAAAIQIVGALPALILLPIVGPRKHRFRGDAKYVRLPGQNNYFTLLGAMLVWSGWYGLISGQAVRSDDGVVARVAVNTTISAVFSCATSLVLGLRYERRLEASNASAGILSGLVGCCAGCATVEAESAVVIGAVSGVIYFSISHVLVSYQIDDVVDVVPINLCCGLWSLVAAGLFSEANLVSAAYSLDPTVEPLPCGIFLHCSGLGPRLLVAQLIFGVAVVVTVAIVTGLVTAPLWWLVLLQQKTALPGEMESETETTGEASEDEVLSSSLDEREEEEEMAIDEDILHLSDAKRMGKVTGSRSFEFLLRDMQSVYPDIDQVQPTSA